MDIKTEIDDVKNESISDYEVDDLSPEDSDLIEVLWKQDVDLGFRLPSDEVGETKPPENNEEEIEKLNALLEVKDDEFSKDKVEDEWAGLNFTIDSETGEYIQLPPLPLDETLLDEVLQLPAFDLVTDEKDEEIIVDTKTLSPPLLSSEQSKKEPEKTSSGDLLEPPQEEDSNIQSTEPLNDSDTGGLVNLLCDMMIQPSAAAFQHPRANPNYGHGMNSFRQSSYHHQSRVPLNRTVSMEQRWQDLANLLSLPPGMGVGMGVGDMAPPHYPSHYPHHYQAAAPMSQHGQFTHHPHSVLHHNASLADLGPTQPHYGPNLGSAVSTSMHLTNSSSETDAGATGYKMEHDMMYYSSGLQTYPPAINTFGNLKNTSSEINHTNDGFLNSILNDEDLQLMDMGINDSSMYTMRLLEQNSTSNNSSVLGSASGGSNGLLSTSSSMHTNLGQLGQLGASHGDRLDASSDSAVSSMGSERVPSLSDGEWGDTGSDSAQEYHQSKYGPFDYSYHSRLGDATRQPPVAQKKHQMFGKRYFQEQSTIPPIIPQQQQQPPPAVTQQAEQQVPHSIKYEYDPYSMQQPPLIPHNLEGAVGPVKQLNESELKYSCSSDFTRHSRQMQDLVSHNHSYTLPQGSGATPRPQPRDKKLKKTEDEHLTRDEKKAREHKFSLSQIPMTVHDIINLPMDEFNERLSKYDLTEVQLSLIRDIRRRGKNKVAAQNCRKRKLDQILTLADEVKEVRRRKERLLSDREAALAEKKSIMDKFSALYRHVFQYLRDPDGNPYSSAHYSLQLAADGNVFVLPRDSKTDNATHNGNHHHHNNNNNNHHQGPSHHHNHQKE
jgi:nuclear factor erythroid 2